MRVHAFVRKVKIVRFFEMTTRNNFDLFVSSKGGREFEFKL